MRDWYDRQARRYDRIEPGLDGDLDFYVGLARSSPAPVLELGCGTGRITIAIARAGIPVVGLDRSPAMLKIARAKADGVADVRWVEADMRDFELDERFGLICMPHRTFQHLLTDEDQRAALARAAGHLRSGGRFALNLVNPTSIAGVLRAPRGATHAATQSPGDHAPLYGSPHAGMRVRYVRPAEMRGLLQEAGLDVRGAYGWFDGRPLREDSTEQVWLGHLPPSVAPSSVSARRSTR